MAKKLVTVAQLAADPNYPFTEPSIRWLVFNAASNGLNDARAIVRVGRRVYIDTDGFDRWLTQQQDVSAEAA